MKTRFNNNLRFALRKETLNIRQELPLNPIEKIGNIFSWFAYEFKDFCLKTLFDPRFVTVCFTTMAMILAALLFYPSDTWKVLATTTNWLIENINWGYMRFCLWIICEVTIFGIGMRAFGRFSNQELIRYYHDHHRVAP